MKNARENTKERILRAALELFAREGYEAVGVAEIAEAVGVKAPSLYKHYKGKRDIFDHILRRMEELDAEAAKACSLPTAPPGRDPEGYARAGVAELAAFARRQFRFWTEDPFAAAFRRMLTVEQYRSAEMAALYRAHLGAGPLEYTAAVLGSMEEAVAFYAPMHLLYAVHDANPRHSGRRSCWTRIWPSGAGWRAGGSGRGKTPPRPGRGARRRPSGANRRGEGEKRAGAENRLADGGEMWLDSRAARGTDPARQRPQALRWAFRRGPVHRKARND